MSSFDLHFLLIFYSVQSVYTLNKKPAAFAVSELFIVVCKFKMEPCDIMFDPCDLLLQSLIVLPIGNVRTKFKVCTRSHYRSIEEMPKSKK